MIKNDRQICRTALAVGCGHNAFRAAEPCQNIGVLQGLVGKVIDKLLLN